MQQMAQQVPKNFNYQQHRANPYSVGDAQGAMQQLQQMQSAQQPPGANNPFRRQKQQAKYQQKYQQQQL